MMSPRSRAVLLLSGGLDSATAGAVARSRDFELYAMTFRYGQRHAAELACARRVAEQLGVVRHQIVDVDLRAFGGSALTADIEVPLDRPLAAMQGEIPVTYVPARNTIFLAFALAWAETLEAADLFLGVNAVDYSGYPDCRPEYLAAFEQLANLATKAGVEGRRFTVHAPLLHLSKRDIIALGLELGVDYGATLSCYDPSPNGLACGRCDACRLRLHGFDELGRKDPAGYRARPAGGA